MYGDISLFYPLPEKSDGILYYGFRTSAWFAHPWLHLFELLLRISRNFMIFFAKIMESLPLPPFYHKQCTTLYNICYGVTPLVISGAYLINLIATFTSYTQLLYIYADTFYFPSTKYMYLSSCQFKGAPNRVHFNDLLIR